MSCILCGDEAKLLLTKSETQRGKLDYYLCQGRCGLGFLDSEQRLSAKEEKERYDLHNNDPDDPGYLEFLRRLTSELLPYLHAGAKGLDFGCGPGPALSKLMQQQGYVMENYDPFYFPDETLLSKDYDFITATEVFEHLSDPLDTVTKLDSMLRPGGTLAIMTEMMTTSDKFKNWWYHTDPTHVCFFNKKTFQWLAAERGWEIKFPRRNVVLFFKPN